MKLWILMIVLSLGCASQKFRSGEQDIKVGNREFAYACTGKVSTGTEEVTGANGTTIIFRGQFCTSELSAPKTSEVNFIYVTDFSGSMQDSSGGADPKRLDGTCGRLDAAKAIATKLKQLSTSTDPRKAAPSIKAANITFGTNALISAALSPLDSFIATSLTSDQFCGSSLGGTNYQTALQTAYDLASSLSGTTYVYFVSDGIPTSSGTGFGVSNDRDIAKLKGREAAQKLTSVPNLILNIVYLKYPYSGVSAAAEDPIPYLQTLLPPNSSGGLKVANNAGDLVGQVGLIDLPQPGSLSQVNSMGILEANGSQRGTFGVRVQPIDPTQGLWRFETDAIPLQGEVGAMAPYRAIVRVKTDRGESLESVLNIQFKRSI